MIDPKFANQQIRLKFCRPMQIAGKCTGDCTVCKDAKRHIFDRMNDAKEVRNPGGLFIWLVRDELSKALEKKEFAKTERNWLGEEVHANPFELLLEEL